MFLEADPGLNFSDVAEVIDMGHAADVDQVSLVTADAAAR